MTLRSSYPCPDGKRYDFKVQRNVIRLVCHSWATKLDGKFSKEERSSFELYHASPFALDIILKIAHMKSDSLLVKLGSERAQELAMLCNRYKLQHVVRDVAKAKGWIPHSGHNVLSSVKCLINQDMPYPMRPKELEQHTLDQWIEGGIEWSLTFQDWEMFLAVYAMVALSVEDNDCGFLEIRGSDIRNFIEPGATKLVVYLRDTVKSKVLNEFQGIVLALTKGNYPCQHCPVFIGAWPAVETAEACTSLRIGALTRILMRYGVIPYSQTNDEFARHSSLVSIHKDLEMVAMPGLHSNRKHGDCARAPQSYLQETILRCAKEVVGRPDLEEPDRMWRHFDLEKWGLGLG